MSKANHSLLGNVHGLIPLYRSMNRKHKFGSRLAVLGMGQEFHAFQGINGQWLLT